MSTTESLLAELSHEINNPLAAIRNALYLIACRSGKMDAQVYEYLQIADEEAVAIATALRHARLRAFESSAGRSFSRAT